MSEEKKRTLWCDTIPKNQEFTDPQPVGMLYKEQRDAAHAWMNAHDAEKHIPPGKTHRYSGAIGGSYTWCLTGTSLGTVQCLKCSCGEEFDVTQYNDW